MVANVNIFRDVIVSVYCAIACAVQDQSSKSDQDLVITKSRISRQDIEIPELGLKAMHVVTRLATFSKVTTEDQ